MAARSNCDGADGSLPYVFLTQEAPDRYGDFAAQRAKLGLVGSNRDDGPRCFTCSPAETRRRSFRRGQAFPLLPPFRIRRPAVWPGKAVSSSACSSFGRCCRHCFSPHWKKSAIRAVASISAARARIASRLPGAAGRTRRLRPGIAGRWGAPAGIAGRKRLPTEAGRRTAGRASKILQAQAGSCSCRPIARSLGSRRKWHSDPPKIFSGAANRTPALRRTVGLRHPKSYSRFWRRAGVRTSIWAATICAWELPRRLGVVLLGRRELEAGEGCSDRELYPCPLILRARFALEYRHFSSFLLTCIMQRFDGRGAKTASL